MVKVRMQLKGSEKPKFISTFVSVVKSEGLLALYKGLSASLLREGSYSTLRMGLYEPFKNLLGGKDLSLGRKILAGAFSGMIGY